MTTFSKLLFAVALAKSAWANAVDSDIDNPVVDCAQYMSGEGTKECDGVGVGCVAEGWFSKDNLEGEKARVNIIQICQDNGYETADPNEWGGNWGFQCRYPGDTRGQTNQAQGDLTNLGFTISWKCQGTKAAPAPAPMVPKPDGKEVLVQMQNNCEADEEPEMKVPIVWAPGVCQPDPMEENQTLIVECKNGGISVKIFDSPNCSEESMEEELDIKHNECRKPDFGQEGQDFKFLLDDHIRKECEDPTFFEPTMRPTDAVPPHLPPVNCVSVGDPHFVFFDGFRADFQGRGEFTLWKTEGLTVQVRQGPNLLATHVHTVSTNNAIAIGGSQVCGHTFEIYAEDGGWMRVWRAGADTADEYFGTANVVAAIQTYDCPTVRGGGVTMGFRFDNSMMNVQVASYGINICLHVEGQAYLDGDSGICTQRTGWEEELNCKGTLFTHYKEGECALLPRPTVIPFDINDCPADLKQEAEKVCNQCPKTIDPEDCVYEVCALGSVTAAADLLEACEIKTQLAPPRDVHCSSLGDPHFLYFDTTRADFQDRGEFTLYETTGVRVMTRHGSRPDIPHVDHISTNHGASVMGDWTCGTNFEFFHDGPNPKATNIHAAVPKLVVTKNGQATVATGLADITKLINQRNRCQDMRIGVSGSIFEFAFKDGGVRVRVQLVWWGINVWVDVAGEYYLEDDTGICTKRTGAFEQITCDESNFTEYPTTCDELVRTFVPPTPVLETCDKALKLQAREACDACPDVVDIDDCIFEVCAVGSLKAAEELTKACEGAKPIIPVPAPTPEPKVDVECVSSGDPHFRYFDRSGGDFQSRGHFTLYKTESWEVQVRQGVHLTLDPSHAYYPRVSTNNAFVVAGKLLCGHKYEVEAVGPSMTISDKHGNAKTFNGKPAILAALPGQNCPAISVAGDIVSFGDGTDYQMRWQVQSWGINIWIDVKGKNYLDSDSGICTKRTGWTAPLECSDVLFTTFPNGHDCAEEKKKDKHIEPETIDKVKCDPALKAEAEKRCMRCPNAVAPRDCVLETCMLGDINAAEELLKACELAPPKQCGDPGKLTRKTGKKMNKQVREELSGKKTKTSCECKDACEAVGGTEWGWKIKNGKCSCFKETGKVIYGARFTKSLVGHLPGSSAAVVQKA